MFAVLIFPTAGRPQGFTLKEIQAGNYVDHYMVGEEVLLAAPLLLEEVQRVADRVASAGGVQCQVRIINSAEVNAFATAGGYFYITTALLDFVESQDELAAVIGHELAHSIGKHYFLQLERQEKKARRIEMFSDITGLVVGAALNYRWASIYRGAQSTSEALKRWLDNLDKIYLESRFAALTEAAFIGALVTIEEARCRGYGKNLELEADLKGAKLAASAGYSDRALVSFFKRMALMAEKQRRAEVGVQRLLGAEPTLAVRIKALEEQ